MNTRTLLLVDDEDNILNALKRLLRRDGYTILTASSGAQGLELLDAHQVGVILSDQRMPGMIGAEFLEHAAKKQPDTIRLMLSGYTELESVTDAINRGALYKFLTKPWDDDLLRENVRQAFEQHELRAERDHLAEALRVANAQLAQANAGLVRQVSSQEHEIAFQQRLLEMSREVLEHLPAGVLGVGDDGVIALANQRAHLLLGRPEGALPGTLADEMLPAHLSQLCREGRHVPISEVWQDASGRRMRVHCEYLGANTRAQGNVLVLLPEETTHVKD